MIRVACPQCGKTLSVKDELAGLKARCPQCALVFVLGDGPASKADEDRALAAGTLACRAPAVAEETLPPQPAGKGAAVSREKYDFLAPAQAPDEIGRLGPYRVLKVLGAGGMGVVFQAEDLLLKRKVALKAMLPGLAVSESARQRFLREAQTAASIEHDHIVPIFQVGEDRGVPFIAMPFLKGEALDERLKRAGPLPLADILRIGRETALGLAAAHKHGLVHRDIKPANLWLEEGTGRVKILDFGLARAAQDSANLTQSGAILGTPAYMAPEQANGKVVDGRTDLFSLGCVLYRLCTGTLPFRGSDTLSTLLAVASENPRPPRHVNASVPQKLSDLVMQLLAKEPDKRPSSGEKVAALLAAVAKAGRADEGATLQLAKKDRTAGPEPARGLRRPGGQTVPKRRGVPAGRPFWLVPAALGGMAVAILALVLAVLLRASGDRNAPATVVEADKTVAGGSKKTESGANAKGPRPGALELLPLIDPAQDTVRGTWTRQGANLVGREDGGHAVIEVPYQPPEEYDYLVEFTRTQGEKDISLVLSRMGHSFALSLAMDGVNYGFVTSDGHLRFNRRPDLALVNGLRYVAKAEVRKDGLVGYLDGQKVSELKTDGTNVSMFPWTRLRNDRLLGLSLYSGATTFHRAAVVEVTGRGQLLRPTPAPAPGAIQTLFNSTDLRRWEKIGAGEWTINNGILRSEGEDKPGWLATPADYSDFELELEYRLGPKGNSGVFVHAWKEGHLDGSEFLEIQLIDDQAYHTVGKTNGTAAIFGVAAASPGVESVPNTWYKLFLRSQGRRLQVSLDGKQVVDAHLDDYQASFPRRPGLQKTTGRIGLQHYGTPVEFRNIRLRPLPAGG